MQPADFRGVRVDSLDAVALRWHWLLVALAAATVACLVPGSMVWESPATSRSASIEPAAPTPSGSECAAVACNPGSPSAPTPAPPLAVAGILAAGALFVLVTRLVRRKRQTTQDLPRGNPLPLLRPPQLALSP
jgi:hypothetical protein